jgi:hypothetical protein
MVNSDLVCHYPFLPYAKLYFSNGCCISYLMLREYSEINHPKEAVKIDQIAVWKGERKMSIMLRQYS